MENAANKRYTEAEQIAQSYCNSLETDRIYTMIWEGSHPFWHSSQL